MTDHATQDLMCNCSEDVIAENPELFGTGANTPPAPQKPRKLPENRGSGQSVGEARFANIWRWLDGPKLESEYRFDPDRRWRADFAHVPTKTIIEIEGGTWNNGRHNRAQGYASDCEKYNAATMAGWRVFRLTTEMVRPEYVAPICDYIVGLDNWQPEY